MPDLLKENIQNKLSSEEYKFFRYSLNIEYLGKNFSGSQKQPGQNTIQSEIERAISIVTKQTVKVILSGRTDSGVHAKYQILHFDTNKLLSEKEFLYSINAILPEDISVKKLYLVDKGFHSIKSAKYRWYRYLINNDLHKSVLLNDLSMHVREPLNTLNMQKALNIIVGVHDFTGFRKSKTENPARICEVYYAKCRKKSNIIYIDLIANRFLYNMVRIIVGTLVEIGKGLCQPETMQKVLESNDRTLAGPTAVPKGLSLMYVGYDEKYNFNSLNMEANINEQNIFC